MAEIVSPQPSVASTSSKFDLKKVLLALVIIVVVAGIASGGIWYYVQSQESAADKTSTSKISTTSAKVSTKSATKSASKDETEGWKSYSSSKLGFSIKYPSDWYFNDAAKYSTENCEPGPGIDENTVLFDKKDLKCQGVSHFGLWPAEFVVYVSPP